MEELKVGTIFISSNQETSENFHEFERIVKEKRIKTITVKMGDKVQIEKDLYFDILWPNNSNSIQENILNNNSIVCKLVYKDFYILFTGDIEELAEKEILKEYKNNLGILKSSVLKVAHHGSNTSSTKEFLEAVNPKYSLIGVAKNNKFGHPNKEVIQRLENIESDILRTDQMGEITLVVDKKGRIKIKKFIE